MSEIIPENVSNFLVPATGTTNVYPMRQSFTATPTVVDFNTVKLNGLAFRPSGVIMDNTAGDGPLTVLIREIGYSITAQVGQTIQLPYPAPLNHTAAITGDGIGVVMFVDYPVMPFASGGGSGGGGDIPNPLPVTGPLTNAQLRAAPVDIAGALTDTELRASAVNVSGPLTNAQLRAAAVPVTVSNTVAVSGPLTNTQLRAQDVPVFPKPYTDAGLAFLESGATSSYTIQSDIIALRVYPAAPVESITITVDGNLAGVLPAGQPFILEPLGTRYQIPNNIELSAPAGIVVIEAI